MKRNLAGPERGSRGILGQAPDMPDAIWVDRNDELLALARRLESQPLIGVDTEFLRERTFFPKLCLLQIAAGGEIWCVDTLRGRVDVAEI